MSAGVIVMRPRIRTAALVLMTAAVFPPLLPARALEADDILRAARLSPTSQPATLKARIRSDEKTYPLTISLRDRVVSYEFSDPEQALLLKLQPDCTRLLEKRNGKTIAVQASRLHDPVRDTGLCYQDLSLGFLYWPRPVLQGEETVKTRPCWKIDLQAPTGEPVYGVARVWIDKENGAILRIEGYDKKGLLLRRFEIVSAQKIDGLWLLKQMRIESFPPGGSSPISRVYLEVLGKE